MKREWTKEQQCAIKDTNHTLLVSAAAGSGKTAVLTERIIHSLKNTEHPGDISRMLIVTFTKAATGELRQRISDALSAAMTESLGDATPEGEARRAHLSRQLMLLGSAPISTIDSFYLDLVKSNFQSADLPPSFRMADDTELLSLRRELMNDTVDRTYAECPDFFRISDIFCDIRREESLTDSLLKLYNDLIRYPEGIDILLRSADNMEAAADEPLLSPWGEIFCHSLSRLLNTGREIIAHMRSVLESEENGAKLTARYGALLEERDARFGAALNALEKKSLSELHLLLAEPFSTRMPGGKLPAASDEFIRTKDMLRDFLAHYKKESGALAPFTPDEVKSSAAETAQLLRILQKALSLFEREYRAAKERREVAEFSDVARAAYRLLVSEDGTPTPLATEIAARYDAVYIDEYQDVSAMQDATFSAISTPYNRFMVGDIKQSIYRFRGAQPAVFASYRKKFPSYSNVGLGTAASIFMSDCFRCDENVIRFANRVSGYLFSMTKESIGYTAEDDLRFHKNPPFEGYQSPRCEVLLIDPLSKAKKEELDDEENDTDDAAPAEARLVASEIKRLLETEKKADGTRIIPSDVAILMRSAKRAPLFAKELRRQGIPANDASRQCFFENADVLSVYSLLATIDNPLRDVYTAATMRSPFFGFTLEDLVQIRTASDASLSLYEATEKAKDSERISPALRERTSDFITRLSLWRQKSQSMPVDRLLRYLYRETAILSLAATKGIDDAPTARRANLRRLYEYARTFEASGFKGLYQFIRYVDDIMANRTQLPAPDGEPNAVSIITMHASKGLEFPVCFLAGLGSHFSIEDSKNVIVHDEALGAAMRLSNAGPFSRANTFWREAIRLSVKRQNEEEEMRILYVAMTRARERLYCVGKARVSAENLLALTENAASSPEAAFLTASGPSYMHWILTALHTGDFSAFANLRIIPEEEINSSVLPEIREERVSADGRDVAEALRDRFAFTYPYRHLSRLPAKLSVSKLSPGVLDVYDTDGVSPEYISSDGGELLLHSFERTPCFGDTTPTPTAAQRGTATHEFLQFCDFKKAEKSVAEELERLIEEAFLPPDTRSLVRKAELTRFFESDFYRSLAAAKKVFRETRFHITLPAANFTTDQQFAAELAGEKLTVQGVIDLFYFDKEDRLILCDYKTDRLSPSEMQDERLAAATLEERYRTQLSYYATALKEICGRHPDKILIYSLPLGKALPISL